MPVSALPSSFRDPSGFLFRRDGVLYRQVNVRCRDDYDMLMNSGLYAALAGKGLLVAHEETEARPELPEVSYKVIRPQVVPFVSYPYEWCFSEYKDAAMATLEIHRVAIEHGMSLKDASAYNVQFADGKPCLIDTLSFERFDEAKPWVAYRQFCQHFLAPLALMGRKDVRLSQLMRVHIDGIPLDLAARLLPGSTRLSFGLLTHLHIHAGLQGKLSRAREKPTGRAMSRMAHLGIIDSLMSTVRKLRYAASGTEWVDYYCDTNYTREGLEHKAQLVGEYLDAVRPATVWDLGANTGFFSRAASGRGADTIAFDIDPAAVERHYIECRSRGEGRILPLVMDLANPSAAIGWANAERMSLAERGPADAALALALVHHLAIGNNVPLGRLAEFLAAISKTLVIEFVPKEDSQVARLLVTREDIFTGYDEASFRREFAVFFDIERSQRIRDSVRSLYLMRRKGHR